MESGYVMSDRTLDNIYDFYWKSKFFTRKSFGAYLSDPVDLDIKKAREKAREILSMPCAWKIDDELEKIAEQIYNDALNIPKK